QSIVLERNAFRADQFALSGNPNAWYQDAAKEILEQTDGAFDAFCDFVGSGGTFAGLSKAFKECNPGIKCYIIEPVVAAVIGGGEITNRGDHRIQGGGYADSNLQHLENVTIDGCLTVTEEDAYETSRLLARVEGIFVGPSSGANVHGAIQLLEGPMSGKTVLVVLSDSGLKYLSTNLWE
ncbi:MAG: pyridoxal-phosphate dependent enzyme, partial [Candidatus Thorarchaeota archaeon]